MSRYVQRLGRIFEALQILDLYPQGVAVADLAEVLGCSADEIRADLAALNAGSELGPERAGGFVLFLGPGWDEISVESDDGGDTTGSLAIDGADDQLYVDATEAVAVRLYGPDPRRGVGGLSVSELGAVWEAAEDLARVEPGNEALARVVAELRSRWLPGVTDVWRPSLAGSFVQELSDAVAESRRVWIRYERLWQPGVIERLIEPYEIVRTHRGFEVDAGPLDDAGNIRSYVVDEIRELHRTDEVFTPPEDVTQLCRAHRQTTTVTVVVPRDREWTAEYLAEEVVVEDRDDDVQLRLELLEPVGQRVGLIVLQAGAEAFVGSPAELADAAGDVAARLWRQHNL